jgi:hypothetical protein
VATTKPAKKVTVKDFQDATKQAKPDDALRVVNQLIAVGSRQAHVLRNIRCLTVVYGPTGILRIDIDPEAITTLEKVADLERVLLNVQASLVEQKKVLLAGESRRETQEASEKNE